MIRSLLVGIAVVATPCVALAADIMIHNGFAPPVAPNVIDHASWASDDVWVRNVGCPPSWGGGAGPGDPCPSPGALTTVAVESGGAFAALLVDDTSQERDAALRNPIGKAEPVEDPECVACLELVGAAFFHPTRVLHRLWEVADLTGWILSNRRRHIRLWLRCARLALLCGLRGRRLGRVGYCGFDI